MNKLKKIVRYARIYDVKYAFVKAIGRTRIGFPLSLILSPLKFCKTKDIAIIGCGQFSFSIIAFFLTKHFGRRIGLCVDIDESALSSFARCYAVPYQNLGSIDESCLDQIKLAYIASNHASHTDYAIYFLKRGIDVYIEKPVSVSMQQFDDFKEAVQQSAANAYFGYNRPFSSAIKELVSRMNTSAITLNCTVMGHFISQDHWYRKPEEGTRVCGNLGHWIDLAVHLLTVRGGASTFDILIAYSDPVVSDDNMTVVLSTEKGDLITLTMTSRDEPFEGINETIVFHQKNLFVKIDDFRHAQFQQGSKKFIRKYKPKDVGHEQAIMQPWREGRRDIREVFLSTELMLHIMDMVKNRQMHGVYEHETDLAIT